MFVGFKSLVELEGDIANEWIGLYGENWLIAFYACQLWVEEMLNYIPNKKSFYQQGLRAITLIQQPL